MCLGTRKSLTSDLNPQGIGVDAHGFGNSIGLPDFNVLIQAHVYLDSFSILQR